MRTLKWLLALLLLTSTLSVAGCHTVQGAGKDVQDIGQAGEDAIDDVRR